MAFVIRPAIAVKANLRAAGREHTPFVFVLLLRRHALEFVGIERDALACRHVDANRPRRLVEPGIANGHEKPVRPLVGRAALRGHDEIYRPILAAVDDDALQVAGRPVLQIEDVDRLERPAPPPIEVGRQGIGRALVADSLHWLQRRGVTNAVVNTQVENERALQLYLATGFRLQPSGLEVLGRTIAEHQPAR